MYRESGAGERISLQDAGVAMGPTGNSTFISGASACAVLCMLRVRMGFGDPEDPLPDSTERPIHDH